MKIVVVDDELLAVELISYLVKEIGGHEVIAQYTSPLELLENLSQLDADLFFLDIEMHEMNGITLATHIADVKPDIPIVFVTAYDNYAYDAFKVHAVDYLVKPIDRRDVVKTLERIENQSEITNPKVEISIQCFGALTFTDDKTNENILQPSWRTTIAKELFCYLLENRESSVRKDILIEHFWPGSAPKNAYAQLYSTVYNIRKLLTSLEMPISIESTDLNYKLELNGIKVDVDEWERALHEVDTVTEDNCEQVKEILYVYHGKYFGEEEYVWAKNEQERLRIIWLHNVKKVANFLIKSNQYTEAILFYLDVQKVDPLLEENYFQLMKLYHKIGERGSVITQFNKLSEMLDREYGICPSEDVINWYDLKGYKLSLRYSYFNNQEISR